MKHATNQFKSMKQLFLGMDGVSIGLEGVPSNPPSLLQRFSIINVHQNLLRTLIKMPDTTHRDSNEIGL